MVVMVMVTALLLLLARRFASKKGQLHQKAATVCEKAPPHRGSVWLKWLWT